MIKEWVVGQEVRKCTVKMSAQDYDGILRELNNGDVATVVALTHNGAQLLLHKYCCLWSAVGENWELNE